MTTKEAATQVLKSLEKWNPKVWHISQTGSTYIKFSHWKLGSIRISDHPGRKKYNYKWRINVNRFNQKNVKEFVKTFEEFAKNNDITPKDKQLWEDYKEITIPDWKKAKYIRTGLIKTGRR